MKRKTIALMTALILSMSLLACGSDDPASDTNPGAERVEDSKQEAETPSDTPDTAESSRQDTEEADDAGEQESAVCTIVQDGISLEVKIDAVDDLITKWTQTSSIPTDGLDEEALASFDEAIEQAKAIYAEYDKVDYQMEQTDDALVETIIIDMTDSATIESLADAGLLPVDGDASALSFKLTVDALRSSGWTVK